LYDLTGGYNSGFLLCSAFTFMGAGQFSLIPEIRNAPK
jgi:hypothetical protein